MCRADHVRTTATTAPEPQALILSGCPLTPETENLRAGARLFGFRELPVLLGARAGDKSVSLYRCITLAFLFGVHERGAGWLYRPGRGSCRGSRGDACAVH